MILRDLKLCTTNDHESLPDLLTRIESGDSIELPRMMPHQRSAVVTTLGILLHLLRRYPDTDLGSMPLLTETVEPAFMQPALEEPNANLEVTDLDYVFARAQHEIKARYAPTIEDWFYALLASQWAISVAKWYCTAGREMAVVVLPSYDGSLGSEVRTLADAYDKHLPVIAGSNAKPTTFMDHMLWAQPWQNEQSVDSVPYPSLIQRAVHLTKAGCSGISGTVLKRRISRGQHLEDPHRPLLGGSPIMLLKSRQFDARFIHACLFGAASYGSKKEIADRAEILDTTQYQCIRICAPAWDTGKTLGYWEELFSIKTQQGGFSLLGSDRPTDLSTRALGAMEAAESVLRKALVWLLAPMKEGSPNMSDFEWEIAGQYTSRLKRNLAHPVTQEVLTLLTQSPDMVAEQQALNGIVVEHLRTTYKQAESTVFDQLHKARARRRFDQEIRKLTGGKMKTQDLPALNKQVYMILHEMRSHLTPDQRAQLRTMDYNNPPIGYWSLLSHVPAAQAEQTSTETVWRSGIAALGRIDPSNMPIGKVLAKTALPEPRAQRLLTATGEALVSQVQETIRWLVAHEVEKADLSTLVALGLADALHETTTRDWCRKRIALDYVRAQKREKTA